MAEIGMALVNALGSYFDALKKGDKARMDYIAGAMDRGLRRWELEQQIGSQQELSKAGIQAEKVRQAERLRVQQEEGEAGRLSAEEIARLNRESEERRTGMMVGAQNRKIDMSKMLESDTLGLTIMKRELLSMQAAPDKYSPEDIWAKYDQVKNFTLGYEQRYAQAMSKPYNIAQAELLFDQMYGTNMPARPEPGAEPTVSPFVQGLRQRHEGIAPGTPPSAPIQQQSGGGFDFSGLQNTINEFAAKLRNRVGPGGGPPIQAPNMPPTNVPQAVEQGMLPQSHMPMSRGQMGSFYTGGYNKKLNRLSNTQRAAEDLLRMQEQRVGGRGNAQYINPSRQF